MNCARNIVTANFSGGGTSATTAPLWQWDYGQVLCVTGIEDLPAAFEVHFSTNRTGGVSTVAVGADGQVTIPNVLLTIGKNLNAWIYLSDAQGEGETEYSILIPVKARPMPETYDAEVTGEFDDVVRQVSEYAETAQTAADNAGASASAAAASADNAAASASAAETAKTAAETAQGKAEDAQAAAETAAQTATEKAQQTAQDAAQSAQSKADAESAAERAEAAQTGAEAAKTDAETAAQGAAASASAASASATSAGQAATSAGQSATAAVGSATTAQGAAQTATTKAGEASASATAAAASETAAQTAQTAAETAAGTATASAATATTKAGEAAQSASSAAQSKTDAEAAATRAETAAASLTVDDALSDSSVNPVQNKVVTAEFADVKSALDDVYQIEKLTIESAPQVINIPFSIATGDTYRVKNNTSATLSFRYVTADNTILQEKDVTSNSTADVKSTVNADHIRIFFNGTGTASVEPLDKYIPEIIAHLDDVDTTLDSISANQQYIFEKGTLYTDTGIEKPNDARIRSKPFYANEGQTFSTSTNENIIALYQWTTSGVYVGMVTDGSYVAKCSAPANGIYRITMKKDSTGSDISTADIPTIVAKLIPQQVSFPIPYINRDNIEKLSNHVDDAFENDVIGMDNSKFTIYINKIAKSSEAGLSNYTGYNVIQFPVFDGLTFIYKFHVDLTQWYGLQFIDANGAYVTGQRNESTDITVTTPENAVTCFATISSPNQIQLIDYGNYLCEDVSKKLNYNIGLKTSVHPLERLTDETGMLDLFLHVGCIGDSLASGVACNNEGGKIEGPAYYQYSWGQFLARKTGNTYYNWSEGGMSTKMWNISSYAAECFDGEHLCEAYIIGLGQNDANYNYTIGSSADINLSDYTQNADSFYGSYGKIIQRIKEVQPKAKIFVITDPNNRTNAKGYNTAIRAMATIFDNVYVIDMREYGLRYTKSPALKAQFRGSHYNAYGYKVFAMMIANYIDWIITTNYTEFTQVELIGTNHSWND